MVHQVVQHSFQDVAVVVQVDLVQSAILEFAQSAPVGELFN